MGMHTGGGAVVSKRGLYQRGQATKAKAHGGGWQARRISIMTSSTPPSSEPADLARCKAAVADRAHMLWLMGHQ